MALRADVAANLGLSIRTITITNIVRGSVQVDFTIQAEDNLATAQAAQLLQQAVDAGILPWRAMAEAVPVDFLVNPAAGHTSTSLPLPQPSPPPLNPNGVTDKISNTASEPLLSTAALGGIGGAVALVIVLSAVALHTRARRRSSAARRGVAQSGSSTTIDIEVHPRTEPTAPVSQQDDSGVATV